jgi:1-deoxy-D-xylulose-5-phosphate synthase
LILKSKYTISLSSLKNVAKILSQVDVPADLKSLSNAELILLCREVRNLIIEVMSQNPGHIGASLGAVEIAVSIHTIFNTPDDKLVWDVGHQAYAHKILTGRKEAFKKIRLFGEISGFPKMAESDYDSFGVGHSSTSISAAMGMAIASQIENNTTRTHIAVIGDGAITGGMAIEALNHLATTQANVLVILNDNDMSIDDNTGGLQEHLNNIDPKNNIFTNLDLKYYGTVNGNDLVEMTTALTQLKGETGPRLLHCKTKKGFGYSAAEAGNATLWHAPGKFAIETGTVNHSKSQFPKTYQEIVGNTLCELGKQYANLAVITPAMASGSKLNTFKELYPNRFFDVAIAEQHAVTFSAGLAANGMLPFCVIYSTFLQRGYDQVIHDVALQNLKVVFLIDRAGLVGNDGATHQGAFDLAFLNAIPNLTIFTPKDEQELHSILLEIPNQIDGPIAIRYARGSGVFEQCFEPKKLDLELLKIQEVTSGGTDAIISIGTIGNTVASVLLNTDSLSNQYSHFDLRVAKPLDTKTLSNIFETHSDIYLIEDGVELGGIAQSITAWAMKTGFTNTINTLGYPDRFIEHGAAEELYASIGMDEKGIKEWLDL